jgi:undecaprenyl-diphosphatase
MRSTDGLSLREAIALGLIQGPAELLPISSSSHTALIPWLLSWHCAELDHERRRAFEVALHGGAAVALMVAFGAEARGDGQLRRGPDENALRPASIATLAPAIAAPVLAGFLFESFIDRRLSSPAPSAFGLAAGSAAMAWSERRWRRRGPRVGRAVEQAGVKDGLLLGAAQALALAPGISRNGATLAVARARGFDRAAGDMLSWQVGMPVIVGAGVLKAARALERGARSGMRRELAAGAASAFCSTLASARALDRPRRARTLSPYVAYRTGLSLLVLRRLWRERRREGRSASR